MTSLAKKEQASRLVLATTTLTLCSSKVVAYWRRVISSNWGCFHVPLGVCGCGVCAEGVCGVAGAAMEEAMLELRRTAKGRTRMAFSQTHNQPTVAVG